MPRSTTTLPPRAVFTSEPVYRFTVQQWHAMIDQGTLTADDPVELIEGVPVFKMPKNPPHIAAGRRFRRAIEKILKSRHFYDGEQPITLADGELEPDGMIVRGRIEDYDSVRVTGADVPLVIEISDSTLTGDRGPKLRSYARAGIPTYWILNVVGRVVEIYSDPDPAAEVPNYRRTRTVQANESIELMLDGSVVGTIRVADLLASDQPS